MHLPPTFKRLVSAPLSLLTLGVALLCALLNFWGDALLMRLAAGLPPLWQRLWRGVAVLGEPLLMLAIAAAALVVLFALRSRLTAARRDSLRLFGWSLPANWIVTEWLQFLFARHTPQGLLDGDAYGYTFLDTMPGVDSFPAASASGAAALALLVATTWPRLTRLALGYATVVGLGLFFALRHYPADVLGGALIGVLVVSGIRGLQYHYAQD